MVNHNNFFMSVEVDPEIQGVLIKNQSIILEPNRQQELEQKGYGDMVKDKLFLKPFESLYLLYTGKLALFRGKKNIGFDLFLQLCKKQDESILTKFLVYRDLRTRGYTVKDGFGFGSDFRVYAKGDFGEKGAKFLVFGLNEGKQEKMGKLQKKVEEITKMGKEPIIAVIQRQGEIIYYKISRMNFYQNTQKMDMQDFEF
uniref:tRNA intron endonuclease n=1 Tax=uncultured marine thaumarchaeote KM3_02_B09 TaxID=1455956 RepID=A0A075G118_9ARCH|nr:tRNA intron endonuclease [uncultured marine thaumarchaeote KM3_02_B09]